jgi:uncharacterized DUF497 family protein
MIVEYPDFEGFDWDAGNRDKNRKHGVESWECEQLFFNKPILVMDDPKHSESEDRFSAFGRTDGGRKLVVVFTKRGKNMRVISARDMNRRERKFYESNGS